MFGDVVRVNRRRLGLTQEELAANAGLNVRSIRKIEAGLVCTPRPATVRLLADAFGLIGADRERFCQTAVGEPTDPPTKPNVPMQLPADVSAFTGRAEQLAYMDALLGGASDQPNAVIISALSGTAGVGKTALAVHWAHRVRDRFSDGQLYVNLRGYDPNQPTDPAGALTNLLAALGVTGQDVPPDLDERAARYRSELADRRMLIVLDNAGSVEQIRPLLPGSSSCTVVVTSRDSLAGLVAVQGAHRLMLDLLPPGEAITLLRRLIGSRCDAEPDAATALVHQCARLPLALRVAAELAISRPTIPLAGLAVELGDQRRRLDLLDGDDPYAAVRTVFSWSTQHLPPDAAATFRLLGLHSGPDIDPYAVAALASTNLEDAHCLLERLSRAHLLQSTGPDRYGMHDLLRAYAAELTHTHDAEQIRHAALSRLLDHYRYTASVAMDAAYPYECERRPRIPAADTPTPDLSDPTPALSWLDTDLPNLLAAAKHASEHGRPAHVRHLSTILHRHLRTRGRYHDALTLHHHALTTSRATGHQAAELEALAGLGQIHRLQGRYDQATDHLEQALQLARAIGHHPGELDALTGLGHIDRRQGRHAQATDHLAQALRIARATGQRPGELEALAGLGRIHLVLGRHAQATDHFGQALRIARATGHRPGELDALTGLGQIHQLQGGHVQATDYYRQALRIARATSHRPSELDALTGLGDTYRLQGRHAQATDHYQQLLDLAHENGDRNYQFEARQGLGRLQHATGDPDAAITHHDQALALASELDQPADQARAHDGLAHAHHALHRHEQARTHWQHALNLLTDLGIDHTEDAETTAETIRAHLTALSQR